MYEMFTWFTSIPSYFLMSEYIPAAEDINDISLLYDKLAEKATTLHKCIQGYTCWLESIKDKSLVIHILVS